MIEIACQIKGKTLHPASPEDLGQLSEYSQNQIVKVKVTGFKKPRSYLQLKLFWACCRSVATNTDDPNWNHQDKVAEQVKIKTKFIDSYMVVEGVVHIKTKSIAFKNLSHMESCKFFDRAFEIMAKFLGCTVEELTENAE